MGIGLYGDPEQLDELAAKLTQRASLVRQHAGDHVRRAQGAHWVSSAAQQYRDTVVTDRAAADQAAANMEYAAAALRAHAQQVRETLATIIRYEREATAWFAHTTQSLLDRAESIAEKVDNFGKRIIADPPWVTWPIGPHNLPETGDLRWLDVGQFMREQGAI